MAGKAFGEALEKVHMTTEQAMGKWRSLSAQPNEVTIEFYYNLSARFGLIIASASAEADDKVTLR